MRRRSWTIACVGVAGLRVLAGCGHDSDAVEPAGSAGGDGGAFDAAPDSLDAAPEADALLPSTCDAAAAQQFLNVLATEKSCVLSCNPGCKESDAPWVCPALADWSSLDHDCTSCGVWDGTYPAPQQGKCAASTPTGDAILPAHYDPPTVLPDGRRLKPTGHEIVLENADDAVTATFPYAAMQVPGTRFVVVADVGYGDHLLRVVDTTKLAAGEAPEVSHVVIGDPASLGGGLAIAPDGTIYASSGAPDSIVRAYAVDATSGALTPAPAKDVAVENATPGDSFPSQIAVSPDGRTLVVAQVASRNLLAYDLTPTGYGTRIAELDIGATDHSALVFDPHSSDVVHVAAWQKAELIEVTLSTGAKRVIAVGREPEDIAFLDDAWLVTVDALGDDLRVVDRVSATVASTVSLADVGPGGHGAGSSRLAYDAANARLYVTLSGQNAVSVLDVTPSTGPGVAPVLKPVGVLNTGWWPTGVVVAGPADAQPGTLTIVNGKGHGERDDEHQVGFNQGFTSDLMQGSVQWVDCPTQAILDAESLTWKQANLLGDLAGASKVSCGEDLPYDFPIPSTNGAGPSPLIEHIVFLVRENKTFDGVLGDLPGVNGDPTLVIAPGKMDTVWPNIRAIAKTFAHGDNFYEDAEASIQGHFWSTFGRTTDFDERTWLVTWGRASRGIPTQGVADSTWPDEGGVFDWLARSGVSFDNMGELFDRSAGHFDTRYGASGIVSTNSAYPDTESACYIASRARSLCNLRSFTYAWLTNDHAFGGQPGMPNPGIMISVNDEATGMIVDAISHSPMWKSSLVVVIEDDPQDGADHVDPHRSLVVLASPWIKRGYVSHTHFDVASLHKLFAHILGLPYNNRTIADAPLPLDLFTSTPDYTPFSYVKRAWTDASCNPTASHAAAEALRHHWDFSRLDDQPGLSEQNVRYFHEGFK